MIGQRSGRVFAFLLLIVIQACSPKTSQVMTPPPSETEIVDLRVVPGEGKTEVVVEGLQPMIYTTFHLTDPDRVVVDIAGTRFGKFQGVIPVDQGPVRSIRPMEGEGNGVGRLEIEMEKSAEANVRTEGTNLIVEVIRPISEVEKEAAAEAETPGPTQAQTPEPVLPPPVQEKKSLPPAKIVKSIRFDRKEDLRLVIGSDGQLFPNVFLLDPKRLVIDLPKVKVDPKIKAIRVKDRAVKQARIGLHSEKVRLVVDLKGPVTYTLEEDGNKIVIHFKETQPAETPKVTAASPMPPEAAPAAPTSEPASPRVEAGLSTDVPVTAAEKLVMAAMNVETKVEGEIPPPVAAQAVSGELKEETNRPKLEENPVSDSVKSDAVDVMKEDTPPSPSPVDHKEILSEEETAEKAKKIDKTEKNEPVARQKFVGRRISLDFQDAEIANVVRLIADVSNLNVVLGEDIKGKVTLKLINVPWDQALDIILKMNNLGQIREGNIIRIATLANIAKQQDEEARAKETQIKAEDLFTRILYVNYSTAKELSDPLKKILSARGDITIDDRTNTLIVKDIERNITEIERLVKTLDTPTPQVSIEARIVQVTPTFNRSLGIQWGAKYTDAFGANGIGISNATTRSPFTAPISDFAVNLPAAPNFGGIGFTFGRLTNNPLNLDLRLSAGEARGLTRIISTPKISVLDNQEAKIAQGESIPYATTSAQGTQTTFVDATLTLLVTPHISPDGGVMMKIKVTKNAPGETRVGAAGPSISKKEATTNVLLRDGETTVIGGIYETSKTESVSGVPFLKDIPILGWFFKTTTKREDTSELLVFLTPRVLK
ncbi:MAG: type IV pilus secretin PilQ [Candidatus Manganitrophaceae bacterium]